MPPPILTDHNPDSGMVTRVTQDAETGMLLFTRHQKVTEILEFNKRVAAMWDKWAMRGRPRMIAHIPMVIYLQLLESGILRDRKALRRWLSQPENRHFRTDNGARLA